MGRQHSSKLIPIPFNPKKVGEKIAYLRKAQGLTQLQLSEKIGVSRSSIAEYERGDNRIYDEMLVRLAYTLNISIDDLLCINQEDLEKDQPSLRFMKRILKINTLTENEQKYILKTIDTFIQNAESKAIKKK
jgi:transcriptional regulator with XRE-family HTH domain